MSVPGFNGMYQGTDRDAIPAGNGYRTYTPTLLRFNAPDSLSPFNAGGINAYAWCAGDPVNRDDPSGHMSWQAGAGIGLAIVGLLGAIFTAGASIAAAGSLSAALASASAVSVITEASAVAADVSGIACALTESTHPHTSALLGWISLGAGVLSVGSLAMPAISRRLIGTSQLAEHYTDMALEDYALLGTSVGADNQRQAAFACTEWTPAGRCLVVYAHGTYGRTYINGEFMNGLQLSTLLTIKIPCLRRYDYVSLAICHSADAHRITPDRALAAVLADELRMPVEGYHGVLTTTFAHYDHSSAWHFAQEDTTSSFGTGMNRGEYLSQLFMNSHPASAFRVVTQNPYNPVTQAKRYRTFCYQPETFFPSDT